MPNIMKIRRKKGTKFLSQRRDKAKDKIYYNYLSCECVLYNLIASKCDIM